MTDGNPAPVGVVHARAATERDRPWTECVTCSGTISRGTTRCPHCGSRTGRKWHLHRSVWSSVVERAVLGALVMALGIVLRRWLANRRRRRAT